MNELALFAGAGGGILGGKLLGWRTICAVELDSYAASVLVARQNDGCLEPFPVWDDITTFDGEPWRGRVDVVSGGFPCQDISVAGKGAGIEGERSGLWGEMARVIREVRPRHVYVENSPVLTSRGLHRVLGDLAEMGFNAQWGVLGADDVGANHIRKRIWINARHPDHKSEPDVPINDEVARVQGMVANAHRERGRKATLCVTRSQNQAQPGPDGKEEHMANASVNRLQGKLKGRAAPGSVDRPGNGGNSRWWQTEPDVGRVADGVASRVDRLKCLGNGQVPAVAATAFRLLRERGSA